MSHCKWLVWLVVACSVVHGQAPRDDSTIATVSVARVVEAEVKLGRRVVGSVRPLRTSTVGSAVDGRVGTFFVQRGVAVQEGQPLAQLRTETLQIELAAAKASRELAQQQFNELDHGSLPETIAEAEANYQGAKSSHAIAQKQLQRLESLLSTRAASVADLDDAQERADAARFRMLAFEALLKRIKDGPRIEAISQAKAQLELATQNVLLLDDRIEKCSITAPFDGFVSETYTEQGAWISQGDPIAQIVELQVVEVEVPATVEHAVHIRLGDPIGLEYPELPVSDWPDGPAVVDRISPVAASRARTFPVFVRVANTMAHGVPVLKAGMLVRVELPSARLETLPLVPKDALVLNGSRQSVFVVEPDTPQGDTGRVREVLVSLGIAWNGRIQVHGNVTQDDLVVDVGNERLSPGDTVRIVRRQEASDDNAVVAHPKPTSARKTDDENEAL